MVRSEPLVCPSCATTHGIDERFCAACGMPLVYAGAAVELPVSDRHERARKISPQYAEGELVRVAGARNQAEGEFIQGLLLEEGVPSLLRRARGFDVPDYLAAGPRDILVPASGVAAAREILLQSDLLGPPAPPVPPWRVLAGLLGGLVLVAIVLWVGTELLA
jgi:hypothetical protein